MPPGTPGPPLKPMVAFLGSWQFMTNKLNDNSISPRDRLNITLGAIMSSALMYHWTHSILAVLIEGIPLGVLGTIIAIILLKKLSPSTYYAPAIYINNTPTLLLTVIVCVGLTVYVWFFSTEDPVSRFVIVSLSLTILLNFLFVRINRTSPTNQNKQDDGEDPKGHS
jgi:hypothetical protein